MDPLKPLIVLDILLIKKVYQPLSEICERKYSQNTFSMARICLLVALIVPVIHFCHLILLRDLSYAEIIYLILGLAMTPFGFNWGNKAINAIEKHTYKKIVYSHLENPFLDHMPLLIYRELFLVVTSTFFTRLTIEYVKVFEVRDSLYITLGLFFGMSAGYFASCTPAPPTSVFIMGTKPCTESS